MTKPVHLPSTTSPADVIACLETDGCVVIDNRLAPEARARLTAELAPHLDRTADCRGDFFGYRTRRVSGLMAKSETARAMAIDPLILAAMEAFLLEGADAIQLNLTQAIRIGPGEPAQILHTDDAMFPIETLTSERMINAMWAVDAFTAENGATLVVPGSHRWPKDRRPEPHEIVAAAMPEGSVLLYLGSLIHGGGANTTPAPRTGLVLSYALGWLKQAENQFLAVPRAQAATFPERLQRLLGYFVHRPNLGCVEGQDPIRLLRGEEITDQGFEEFLPEAAAAAVAAYRRQLTGTS
jgi:ectoine hydroxylase-related dioxygenase (phytanoyl-CoA dioxygenase family)